MGRIVAIGGGEISKNETEKIDREIIKISNKINPNVLFIPTASFDYKDYCKRFINLYQYKLGANVKTLCISNNNITEAEIIKIFEWADIIYVGGGDTVHMLKIWAEKGIIKFLKKAYRDNKILCGLSAGSICWFKYGQSEIEVDKNKFEYIKIEGLNMINGFHCPHFNENNRKKEFLKMIKDEENIVGIGIENNCAIIFEDNKYKVISSNEEGKAFKVYNDGKDVVVREIKKEEEFREILEILEV